MAKHPECLGLVIAQLAADSALEAGRQRSVFGPRGVQPLAVGLDQIAL